MIKRASALLTGNGRIKGITSDKSVVTSFDRTDCYLVACKDGCGASIASDDVAYMGIEHGFSRNNM